MPTAVPVTGQISAARPSNVQVRRAEPAGLARTIAILAVASFVIGFVGFLAMNGAAFAPPAAQQTAALAGPADAPPAPAPAAMPASDDWNLPKAI